MATKGIKTTEFWVSIISPILSAILGAFLPDSSQALVAQIGGVLVSIGYVLSRTMVKSKEVEAATLMRVVSSPDTEVKKTDLS